MYRLGLVFRDAIQQCVHPTLEEHQDHDGGRFACAFSSTLRGLKLFPAKWRCLVPPTSTPKGHNASRWASLTLLLETKHGCEELLNRRRFLRR